jgi:predicted dehydrogenase
MYAGVSPRASVYAPVGAEVADYLTRIAQFNTRRENPTAWELELHLRPDFLEEMLRSRAGDIAVFAGRNRDKMDRIAAAIEAGLHVLADKPWIIDPRDLPKLDRALRTAEEKRLVAYDIMTERYEVTSELQRVFVSDPEICGHVEEVRARSVHHVMKLVSGVPLRRPAWFFDVEVYGEGLADVGTHVVDLVQWTVFADQAIEYNGDLQIRSHRRWPLKLTRAQLLQVTGSADFPAAFDYYCNNSISYTIRGIPVELEIVWNWEASAGSGDVYEARFRGTRASIEIRQGEAEGWKPELYIVPLSSEVVSAVHQKVGALEQQWPGVAAEQRDSELRIVIPERYRVGHEAHFAQVTRRFFEYVRVPDSMPAWERPNMLAKYYVSTAATG